MVSEYSTSEKFITENELEDLYTEYTGESSSTSYDPTHQFMTRDKVRSLYNTQPAYQQLFLQPSSGESFIRGLDISWTPENLLSVLSFTSTNGNFWNAFSDQNNYTIEQDNKVSIGIAQDF